MSEILSHQSHADQTPPAEQPVHSLSPEEIAAGVAELENYVNEHAPSLGSLFGLRHLSIQVGAKWATNLETGQVTAGVEDYLRRGYTPPMAMHDICHEIAAHLREVEFSPMLTHEVRTFLKEPKDPQLREAHGIFHNILSDIAGNKLVYATLPEMKEVARELYSTLLFKEEDYRIIPRHLQFLYKLMRQEMIEGSETAVLPEVDALIAEFRNFKGRGDLIEYSTQVAKSRTEAMPNDEKFHIWTKVIYPCWLELFQQDAQDPAFQQQNQPGSSDQTGAPQQGDPQSGQPPPGRPDFSQHYQQYNQEHHPETVDHEQLDAMTDAIKQQQAEEARDTRKKEREAAEAANPTKRLDTQIRRETGHTLAEKRRYDVEVLKWGTQISQLREVFRSILNERVATKRQLRGNYEEGALLNPETLAQTYIDVQSNHPAPPAYADYETREAERNLTGRTDYVFVFDRSGSMRGERAEAAASSLVICLEALAAMQRDIRRAEEDHNVTVDLDIRTAVYTFNDVIDQPKALSTGLSDKERLDAYALVTAAGGNNADSHVLHQIEDIPLDRSRKQIAIIVSDGQADDVAASRASVEKLRRDGWYVYGVSIASEAAVTLYAPDSQRIDDPHQLPDMLRRLVERTLR